MLTSETLRLVLLTFNPDVRGSNDGEYQKKQNEQKCFQVVRGHAFDAVENSFQQFALRGAEASSERVGDTTIVTG